MLLVLMTMLGLWVYMHYRMYRRYSETVKTHTHSNRANHPVLRQFRALFFVKSILHWLGSDIIMCILSGIEVGILPFFSNVYESHFMVDGYEFHQSFRLAIVTRIVSLLVEIYASWFYWRPQYFQQAKEYEERLD